MKRLALVLCVILVLSVLSGCGSGWGEPSHVAPEQTNIEDRLSSVHTISSGVCMAVIRFCSSSGRPFPMD